MESFVFFVYGLWFWMTRKYRAARYGEAADTLRDARLYLLNDFGTRASTRDRGYMLSHQIEALDLLARHSTFTAHTSRRFASLAECRRFIVEELIGPAPAIDFTRPATVCVPSESFLAAMAHRVAGAFSTGWNALPSLSSLWDSEHAGSIADLRRASWGMNAAYAGNSQPLPHLAVSHRKPRAQYPDHRRANAA